MASAAAIVGWHAHTHTHSHGGLIVTGSDGNQLVLSEWRLGLDGAPEPAALDSGRVRFELENADDVEHSFVLLRTDGVAAELPESGSQVDLEAAGEVVANVAGVSPGSSSSVSFDIQPGSYVLVCNTPGHYRAGMYYALDVE